MQVVRGRIGGQIQTTVLPDEHEEIVRGVRWGRPDQVPSPAFWAALAWMVPNPGEGYIRCGGSLIEEVSFCLLGGHGVTAELAHAAYEHLKAAGVFEPGRRSSETEIDRLLRDPLLVNGRTMRYRFPQQRARRVAIAIRELESDPPDERDHRVFRNQLMRLPGVGPKTASWVTRNWLGSDAVAILDVHLIRACRLMGLFKEPIRLPAEYETLECKFLDFAENLGVRAAMLDVLIWQEMRQLNQRRPYGR